MYPHLLRECLVRLLQVGDESMGGMGDMECMDMVEADKSEIESEIEEVEVEVEVEEEEIEEVEVEVEDEDEDKEEDDVPGSIDSWAHGHGVEEFLAGEGLWHGSDDEDAVSSVVSSEASSEASVVIDWEDRRWGEWGTPPRINAKKPEHVGMYNGLPVLEYMVDDYPRGNVRQEAHPPSGRPPRVKPISPGEVHTSPWPCTHAHAHTTLGV